MAVGNRIPQKWIFSKAAEGFRGYIFLVSLSSTRFLWTRLKLPSYECSSILKLLGTESPPNYASIYLTEEQLT